MGPEHRDQTVDAEALWRDRRVRDIAFMLLLIQTGTEFESGRVEAIINELADAADEHGASPDDVQSALEQREPTLGPETTHNG
jgi:hypothetical protein